MRFFSASSFAWQEQTILNSQWPSTLVYHCNTTWRTFENPSLDLGTALVLLALLFILLLALLLGDAAGQFLLLLALGVLLSLLLKLFLLLPRTGSGNNVKGLGLRD